MEGVDPRRAMGVASSLSMTDRLDNLWGEIRPVLEAMNLDLLHETAQKIVSTHRLFLAGAGRSGLLMEMLAMRLMQAGKVVHVVGDATTPAIEKGDLLCLASGSGETSTMRAIATKGREVGAEILLFTYTPDSSLAKLATTSVFFPVPRDPSRPGGLAGHQRLGTRFDLCLFLWTTFLIDEVVNILGETDEDLQRRHANLE